jgi:hypothetical protein
MRYKSLLPERNSATENLLGEVLITHPIRPAKASHLTLCSFDPLCGIGYSSETK